MFNVSDAAYDNFMGRYSMPLAPVFADFAGIVSGQRVLDVGAGTGALTVGARARAVRSAAAADPSPPVRRCAARAGCPDVDVQEASGRERCRGRTSRSMPRSRSSW